MYMDIRKALRESLHDLDLFHLKDSLFQYFDLDEAQEPVEIEMRNIISDEDLLNSIISNPESFLNYENSKVPRNRAFYLITAKYLSS